MMSPGSAGFCTLLLGSSPVVSIPSPPKHPSRPLLYPSRTPLAPPFRGVPLPIHPLKQLKSPYLQAFTLYIIMCISKRWVPLKGGLLPKIVGQTEKMRTFWGGAGPPGGGPFGAPGGGAGPRRFGGGAPGPILQTTKKEAPASANTSFPVIFQRHVIPFSTPFNPHPFPPPFIIVDAAPTTRHKTATNARIYAIYSLIAHLYTGKKKTASQPPKSSLSNRPQPSQIRPPISR